MVQASVQLYPNNEIRLVFGEGAIAQRGLRGRAKLEEREAEIGSLTLLTNFNKNNCQRKYPNIFPNGEHKKIGPGWGMASRPKRFTTAARRKLLRVGGVIDASCRKSLFITLTVPGSTKLALAEIGNWTGYLMNRLATMTGQIVGGYHWWISAWEWQKRGALHLHYVVCGTEEELAKIKAAVKPWWIKQLKKLSDLTSIDLFARDSGGSWRDRPEVVQVDAEIVRKSVAAYLSKYLGKGRLLNKKQLQSNPLNRSYPSRWSGCSRSLGQKLAASVLRSQLRAAPEKVRKIATKTLELAASSGCLIYQIRGMRTNEQYAIYGSQTPLIYQEIAKIMADKKETTRKVPNVLFKLEIHHVHQRRLDLTAERLPKEYYDFMRGCDLRQWQAFYLRGRILEFDAKKCLDFQPVLLKFLDDCDRKLAEIESAKRKKQGKGKSEANLDGQQMKLPY